MKERTNDQWLSDLRGPRKEAALADLRLTLVAGLRTVLRGRGTGLDPSAEDCAQEAIIKILRNLDSFRSESRFIVWAHKIAVRTAFAQLRRHRWQEISLDEMIYCPEANRNQPEDPLLDPEGTTAQRLIMSEFRRFIDEELTSRQRTAILAALGGMPLEEIARRMGTNRNALYKLLHDARKKLRRRMISEMLSPQDVLATFEVG